MTQLPNINNSFANSQSQEFGAASALNDVTLDDFLNLMITELQNQDPLNPLENDELIAQISQIREVGATEQLTETLSAVLLGQNISSATNLIGAQIEALSDDGQRVNGIVERISISDNQPKLHLDETPRAAVSEESGELEQGTYSYKVVWGTSDGERLAVELETSVPQDASGAIELSNLPVTSGQKQIYRTDNSGTGRYYLVETLTDGSRANYLDTTADSNLSKSVLTGTPFPVSLDRSYSVSLPNVSEIRPPGQ